MQNLRLVRFSSLLALLSKASGATVSVLLFDSVTSGAISIIVSST